VSGVRVCVSFQVIPHVVGRLGSEVRVSVSFQSFALRMFVLLCFLPSSLLSPVPERSFICPACPVVFYGKPHNGAGAVAFSTDPLMVVHMI